MEKEKTSNKKKVILGTLAVLLLGGGIFGYKMYQKHQMQQLIDGGMVSPEPTLPAIDQKTFEELPVGVIYEVPEELQNQYLQAAKAKYEKYGYLGPQQKVFLGAPNMTDLLKEREDVVPRDNNQPSDMLNDDMSLRYPDMFYGFVIHDENLEGLNTKQIANNRFNNLRENNSVADKMNQILFVEDYYSNGGKISDYTKTLEKAYLDDLIGISEESFWQMVKKAIKSGMIKSSNDIGINNALFQYFNFIDISQQDIYHNALGAVQIYNTKYFHEADGISVDNALKYNIAEKCEGATPVFYYPVRVWKVDNNTIIVDIEIENGEHLTAYDVIEIFTKLSQANVSKDSKDYNAGDVIKYENEKYMVFGRLFNSDITQGLFSEFGTSLINYKSIGLWNIGNMTCAAQSFVPNEKAKNLLSDFFKELKQQIDNGETPSTRKIMKTVAEKNNIPYKDALAIYGTYYLQSIRSIHDVDINW